MLLGSMPKRFSAISDDAPQSIRKRVSAAVTRKHV